MPIPNEHIIIDDLRSPKFTHLYWENKEANDVTVIRTLHDALGLLNNQSVHDNGIHCLYLDHDLGEIDGLVTEIKPFIKKLCELSIHVDRIVVHTANPVAREWIVSYLSQAGYNNVLRINPLEIGLVYT